MRVGLHDIGGTACLSGCVRVGLCAYGVVCVWGYVRGGLCASMLGCLYNEYTCSAPPEASISIKKLILKAISEIGINSAST